MGENTDRNVVVASETAETWATELPCAAPHDNVDRPSHAEILRRGSPVTTGPSDSQDKHVRVMDGDRSPFAYWTHFHADDRVLVWCRRCYTLVPDSDAWLSVSSGLGRPTNARIAAPPDITTRSRGLTKRSLVRMNL